jgi:hypothetical protein
MRFADATGVLAVLAVAVAAILGGAFYPGPRIAVGLSFAVTLAAAVYWRRDRLQAEEWACVVFLGWGVAAGIVGRTAPLAVREVLTVWLVAFLLWMTTRRANARSTRMASHILVGVAVILVIGVALEAAGIGRMRVGGLLENPNLTACLLVVSLCLLPLHRGQKRRWAIVVAVVLVAGVVLTGSRAGLLALLAVVAVVLPRGRARSVGLAVGAGVVAAVVAWRFLSQPDILAWFRPAIWWAVLQVWAEHPVAGVGPGGLVDAAGAVRLLHADHVGQHQFLIAYAESSPLAVLVQTGVVGFTAALVAMLMWGRAARARGAFDSTPLRSALAVMVVMALFHDLITVDIVLWWWAAVIGLLEAPSVRITPVGDSWPEPRGTPAVRALVVAYIMLWGMVEPSWARWLWRAGPLDAALVEKSLHAEPWYEVPLLWRSRNLFQQERWTWETAGETIARSRHAVRVRPSSAVPWGELGIVQARVVTNFGPWPDSVEDARESFLRATELEPRQPWHWLEWARFERSVGDLGTAVKLAHRAIEAEPHAVRAWLFIARLELDRGQVEAARLALGKARDSAALRARPGLNSYEKELVSAPEWQFRELEEALR